MPDDVLKSHRGLGKKKKSPKGKQVKYQERHSVPVAGLQSLHRSEWAGPSTVQCPCPVGNNPALAGSGRDELMSLPSYFIETKIMSEV